MSAWLEVPIDDYEGHMRTAGVEQLDVLAELFAEVLRMCRPASVAILGVAGGNGLDAIDPAITTRVVGVDVNQRYLDVTRTRFAHLSGLDLHCVDLARETLAIEAVDLVHAAVVFEHAGTGRCLDNALALVAPDGHLSVVLQLPSDVQHAISPSPFVTMRGLGRDFAFVDRDGFIRTLGTRGWRVHHETTRPLPGGKAFWMGIFDRSSTA